MNNETDKDRIFVFNPDREQSAKIKEMNNMNFSKDPVTAFFLGDDEDNAEVRSLAEVIDSALRKKIASGKDMSDEDIDAKVEKAKRRLANFISQKDGGAMNPLFLLFALSCFSGSMMTDGFRGVLTDSFGNAMPEDVFKNEYMPLLNKVTKLDMLIKNIEALTEENTNGNTVPVIVSNLFVFKDELLELLRGRKEQLEAELKEIIERHTKKDGENLDNPK